MTDPRLPRSSGGQLPREQLLKIVGPRPEKKPALTDDARMRMTEMGVPTDCIAEADDSPSLAEACHEFLELMGELAEAFNGCRKRLAFCLAQTLTDKRSAPGIEAFLNKAFCTEGNATV